jgi:hypothetical protein
MRSTLVFVIAATSSVASAGQIELVAKVPFTDHNMLLREAGDPRYVAVSSMSSASGDDGLDVLDLDTSAIVRVRANHLGRTLHVKTFEAELVSYTPTAAGLHVGDGFLERAHHHWYVEVDPRSGKRLRTIELGTFDDRTDVFFLGTDPKHGAVWFYLERFADPLKDSAHQAGPEEVVLRRVDLATLAIADTMTVKMHARRMASGYEDRLTVHHARDFSRFAIVEYDERAFKSNPEGSVYVIDPERKTWFTVPALDTTYGVAFSTDGAYAYLASSQLGTIARVDLAKERIDKTVAGPRLTQDVVLSPDGSTLFVIGSSRHYTTFALPGLDHQRRRTASPEIAPATEVLFGAGSVSADGRFYVLRDEDSKRLVVARFAD